MAKRFRTTWVDSEGNDAALFFQAKVTNVNLVSWTVDVVSIYDRKFFGAVQVASPYLHYNQGEGIYALPEVGAVCMVCIPGDSSPPFVACFLMPFETLDVGDKHKDASEATFGGGRDRGKPGDIVMTGRDGQFVKLHRGGVLQIGTTPLAQRMYIPMGNLMMDISQRYAHHNSAGSVIWGLQEGNQKNLPATVLETYRVYANDKYADVRVMKANVLSPLGEPPGDKGEQSKLDQLSIGNNIKKTPILVEVDVCPDGFEAANGQAVDGATDKAVYRFLIDRDGGMFMRCAGSLLISSKKKIVIKSDEGIEVTSKKDVSIHSDTSMNIHGGKLMEIKGEVIKLKAGTAGVARVGDMTKIVITGVELDTTKLMAPAGGGPCTGVITGTLTGTIISGNLQVLA